MKRSDGGMTGLPRMLVIGGSNLDITGASGSPLVMGDSNIGSVTLAAGGVGRNIAENLARMGFPVELVTAMGDDTAAELIRQSCLESGVSLAHSLCTAGVPSGTYLCINDFGGDMIAAINQTRPMAHLTPGFLAAALPGAGDGAAVAAIDANLAADSMEYIAANLACPIVADTVSAAKCMNLAPILGRIHTLKPNAMEAMAMTGAATVEEAGEILTGRGVKRVFITLGARGIYYTDGRESGTAPAFPAIVVNTTGAGDAATAALAAALALGLPLRESAELANEAAAIKLGWNGAVNPAIAELDILKGRPE